MNRYLFFLLAIALGIAGGLYYGWVVSPVELIDTTPATLRVDYKSDYVLMVAEAYAVEGDPAAAVCRLAQLGGANPRETINAALVFAVEYGYTPDDLVLMQDLADALEGWQPGGERCAP